MYVVVQESDQRKVNIDWVIVGCLAIATILLCFIIVRVHLDILNECTINPLSYGAEKFSEQYNGEFNGYGFLYSEDLDYFFYFNETAYNVQAYKKFKK